MSDISARVGLIFNNTTELYNSITPLQSMGVHFGITTEEVDDLRELGFTLGMLTLQIYDEPINFELWATHKDLLIDYDYRAPNDIPIFYDAFLENSNALVGINLDDDIDPGEIYHFDNLPGDFLSNVSELKDCLNRIGNCLLGFVREYAGEIPTHEMNLDNFTVYPDMNNNNFSIYPKNNEYIGVDVPKNISQINNSIDSLLMPASSINRDVHSNSYELNINLSLMNFDKLLNSYAPSEMPLVMRNTPLQNQPHYVIKIHFNNEENYSRIDSIKRKLERAGKTIKEIKTNCNDNLRFDGYISFIN